MKDYPKSLKEAVAMHQILRTFGYLSDEIFLIFTPNQIIVQLKTKEINIATCCESTKAEIKRPKDKVVRINKKLSSNNNEIQQI